MGPNPNNRTYVVNHAMLRTRRIRLADSCCVLRSLLTVGIGIAWCTASGQTGLSYKDLHDFSGTSGDGSIPYSTVTFDASGNAYGTTSSGGSASDDGMVWKISISGVFSSLHNFGGTVTNADGETGPDGKNPFCTIAFDTNGDMFGTASTGGASNEGMVWEITSTGTYLDLHDFGGTVTNANGTSGADGTTPYAAVTIDKSGNLYGTAFFGGPNVLVSSDSTCGMVWEITSSGAYKDLHDFGGTVVNADGTSGPDGFGPYAGVALDSAGDLFGTTNRGNPANYGMIWELTAGGTYMDRHDFGGTVTNADGTSGPDGVYPYASINFDKSGNMYGCANAGGPNGGDGMIWEIESGGSYKDLHDFGGTITNASGTSGSDGISPFAEIVMDSGGNMYGTTAYGGPAGDGLTWELMASGTYLDLHDFGGTVTNANGTSGLDGESPWGGVTLDASGNLYGTATIGGPSSSGMVWALIHAERVTGLTLSPTTIGGLGTTTGTIKVLSPAPAEGWPVTVHAGASGYLSMPSTVTIPAGATSATFTINGLAQRPTTLNMGIFASDATSSAEALLEIQGDSLKSFTLSPAQIKWTAGTSTATLTIASAAPPGGWIVNLTPGVSGYVNMPASVTIPSGSTSTTFSITGNALRFFTLDLGITASDGGSKATATLVIAGDAVKSISLSPSTIGWGGTSTATVSLVVAAPPGGWLVNTNPGASGYVAMPSSITVPAGATSATFTITAGSQRSSNLSLGIYANDGPSNQSATLTIDGDSVKSLSLSPSTIGGAGTSTATVTLASAAPPGGWALTLHPGASGYVTMPSTLTVPSGATTATFTITGTSQRDSTVNLGVFASDGNTSQEAVLTLAGDAIKALTLNPSSVAPGAGSTGTITLNSAAPTGGWVVKLTAGAPSLVTVPASVTVPAGATSATFSITTKASDPAGGVGIIANDQVMNLEAILTIT